ncbi:hypothetical protein C0J52_18641 [Blattella germanica]|nr:hypothetical protein C0J52_18641 [Blattella germanica]
MGLQYHSIIGLNARSPTSPTAEEPFRTSPNEGGVTLNRGSQPEIKRNTEPDPLADQDILENIEHEYFSCEGFDPCSHELKVFVTELNTSS